MTLSSTSRHRRRTLAGLALAGLTLAGCSSLLPEAKPLPAFFTLDVPSAQPAATRPAPAPGAPTLVVSPPRAAAGLDSQNMLYTRQPHQLETFARHQWVDTPARMLAPLIVAALERSAAFGAVVRGPGAADAALRLDTEVLRLQQQFDTRPSQLRFTLRAQLVDTASRQVLAWRSLDASVPTASDDPRAGAAAANAAVQEVLAQLAQFCAETAAAKPLPAAQR
jgi:cholesterol transport system auxiliary component